MTDYLNTEVVEAAAQIVPLLRAIEDKLDGTDFYLGDDLRLWHFDGWSQGRFRYEDDAWRFDVEYVERGRDGH